MTYPLLMLWKGLVMICRSNFSYNGAGDYVSDKSQLAEQVLQAALQGQQYAKFVGRQDRWDCDREGHNQIRHNDSRHRTYGIKNQPLFFS